ncbi:MAG TPA: hypothetical protein PLR32_04200 [candidate division Zixibacteria bacterium]|nr:hypothetical protein [candidate division Zixibacteria bacterium]
MDSNRTTCMLAAVMRAVIVAGAALLLLGGSPAHAEHWFFGVGTGFTFMNIQGEQGYTVINYGPVQYDLDLDPDDISDVLESAFGFAGYATDGTWIIQNSLGVFTLGGDGRVDLPPEVGGGTLDVDVEFNVTNGKITLGRTVYRDKKMKFSFTPYAGLRYLRHEINADFVVTQGDESTPIFRGRDYKWTDALVGATISYRLTPRFTWTASGDAVFGGSDGTFYFTTSLPFTPTPHFSFGPNLSYTAIDYENDDKGDADWYLYDADEFGAGIFLAVNF